MQITLVENFFSEYRSIKKRKKSDLGLLFYINEKMFRFDGESFEGDRDNQSLRRVFEWRDDSQSAQFLRQLYHKEL